MKAQSSLDADSTVVAGLMRWNSDFSSAKHRTISVRGKHVLIRHISTLSKEEVLVLPISTWAHMREGNRSSSLTQAIAKQRSSRYNFFPKMRSVLQCHIEHSVAPEQTFTSIQFRTASTKSRTTPALIRHSLRANFRRIIRK